MLFYAQVATVFVVLASTQTHTKDNFKIHLGSYLADTMSATKARVDDKASYDWNECVAPASGKTWYRYSVRTVMYSKKKRKAINY